MSETRELEGERRGVPLMRAHGQRSLIAALALTILITSTGYPPRSYAASQLPNLGVNIMRPGPDWRSLIAPGQTITVNVGVSNLRGDAAAHNTALTVLLPAGLALKQSRPAPSRTETAKDGVRLTWNLGAIEAGAFPRMFDLDLQAAADLKRGTALSVEGNLSTTDKVVDDSNTRSALVLSVENAAADLIVESNLEGAPFTVDNPVDFKASVNNFGTTTASACVLKMTVPPRSTFKWSDPWPSDQSGNTTSWNLGDIAPAQSRTVKIRIVLDPILRAAAYGFAPKLANLTFVLDASTTSGQFNPADGHLEIARFPEPAGSNVKVSLNVAGAEHPGELATGKDVTYEVIYGNFGNAQATQVSVTLSLPDGLGLLSAQPPAIHSTRDDKSGTTTLSWDLGDLRVGQSGVIKTRVHVTSVSDDGSLVSAKISAAGKDINSPDKTAYSLRYAAKR